MEFTLKAHFKAATKEVYTAWLTSEMHSAMTGGEAEVTDGVGDLFSAWDGYILGRNLELEPYKRIVQSWRTTEFEDEDPDSKLEIILVENDGETTLILHHTQLPENGENYKKGWDEFYFRPMKAYFESK